MKELLKNLNDIKILDYIVGFPVVREKIAACEDISNDALLALSEDSNNIVRSMVAANKSVSAEILEKLSNDNDYYVLLEVAKNAIRLHMFLLI